MPVLVLEVFIYLLHEGMGFKLID